ncbi:MAG: hypothetical protein JW744_05875 [Candidatus Diapherotrites archaeon]|uniref:Uncharacterized protein n=1 Tax=Candidatus Iainarchaeum sp. TaxID=3101447 RepID=A0A939C7T0_9ARCH|nr:hypothetical protein [Candidatus Diapherotrites archaeon]
MNPQFPGPRAGNALLGFRGSQFFGFSFELLLIELAYFLIVFGVCLIVYLKTRELYSISQHRGLFHFRNIFLFFGVAYFFRLVQVLNFLSQETLDLGLGRGFFPFVMPVVSFFSTMALLSLLMSVLTRNIDSNVKRVDYTLYAIAFVSSLVVFATRSENIMMAIQTIILAVSVLFLFVEPSEKTRKRLFSPNRVTYLLLAVLWIVNLLAFSRAMLSLEFKLLLYCISAAVFISVLLRVQKRLPPNAKKTKPS